jgi:hypothetical protein
MEKTISVSLRQKRRDAPVSSGFGRGLAGNNPECLSMRRHADSATRLVPIAKEEVTVVEPDNDVAPRGKNVAKRGANGFRFLKNAGNAGMHWVRLPERGYATAMRRLIGSASRRRRLPRGVKWGVVVVFHFLPAPCRIPTITPCS